jgi:hypothetical protein
MPGVVETPGEEHPQVARRNLLVVVEEIEKPRNR